MKGILAVIISKILLLQEKWLKIMQLLVCRNERTKYVFTFQNTPGESSEFRTRMKELLVIFPDTLTVALTATIQIDAQNIHA